MDATFRISYFNNLNDWIEIVEILYHKGIDTHVFTDVIDYLYHQKVVLRRNIDLRSKTTENLLTETNTWHLELRNSKIITTNSEFEQSQEIKNFNFQTQRVKIIGCKNQKVLVLWRKIFFLTGNYLVYKGIKSFYGEFKSYFLTYLLERTNKNIHSIIKLNSIKTLNGKNLLAFFFFKKFLRTKNLLECVKLKKWIFHENFEVEKNLGILFLKIRLSILMIYKNIIYYENFF